MMFARIHPSAGCRPSAQYQARGFVLAAVLWLLAGLGVIVALMGDGTLATAQRVVQLRERVAFVSSAYSSQAYALTWLVSAQAQAVAYSDGVSSILVNNVPYSVVAGSSLRLQDHAGLMDLNQVNRPLMSRFLINCGVTEEKVDALIDALQDYVDTDNLSRLNGAEQEVYSQAKLPLPRNGPLLSEEELWRVYGWKGFQELMQSKRCDGAFSVHVKTNAFGASMSNMATAPAVVLRASGLDEASIEELEAAKLDLGQINALAALANERLGNVGIFGIRSAGQASQKLLLTHQQTQGALSMRYTVELLPLNESKPWFVNQPVIKALDSAVRGQTSTLPWPTLNATRPQDNVQKLLPL